MLDSETRRRIDTARDILVGKVPDPKSQVEQITIALVYKFMDDMDMQSVEMGGKRSFFKGKFEKYSWSNIFNPRLGGIEMLALYGEAITSMSQNESLPQLFRDIFKNAFLPYRDPETLKLFLKTINEFSYDHSEKLGDAFEYLLSVLGSQGDAGQFRTPRHIIDFMVQVVDPKKNETVLDPACGTAGFLISAYKYIIKSNQEAGKPLTIQEKQRLYENFTGYDISPDMVRLSLVNLYLHGFVKPQIHEYDTLASEERWNEYADVILANPPFMSPKGGIQPHKRFSLQSNRSEVLFVDYMAEHLTPNGRAAIIVPEGIIFQSAGAYKQLRKYLIEENYLWAVVSLPAGVFNPYAGVKTSILFLDRSLAKKTDQILFVKVAADGFDLGAQRRPIDRNDLPEALNTLKQYQEQTLRVSTPIQDLNVEETLRVLTVPTSRLAENGDYNLSADRYREVTRNHHQSYPTVAIGDICTFEYGKSLKAEKRIEGEFPVYGSNGVVGYHNEYLVEAPFLVVGRKGSAGEVHYSDKNGFPIDTTFYIKLENENKIMLKYLYHILKSLNLQRVNIQAGVPGLNRNDAYRIQIPLPPLEIQRQIVDEIAAYQRIIDGARQVVEGWKPTIEIDPNWATKTLGEVCEIKSGGTPSKSRSEYWKNGRIPWYSSGELNNYYTTEPKAKITDAGLENSNAVLFPQGSLLVGMYDTAAFKMSILDRDAAFNQAICGIKPNSQIDMSFLYLYFSHKKDDYLVHRVGIRQRNLSKGFIEAIEIPVPPSDVQREIVTRIERERAIVEGNRELIKIYEEKIKKVIERVWEG